MSSKKSRHSSEHGSHHHHSSRSDVRYKGFVSSVIAFLIMIASASAMVAIGIIMGICNPDVLKKSVNESSYYDEKLAEATERLENRLESSGLPAELAAEVITDRLLSVDTNHIISAGLSGDTGYAIDTTEFENELLDKINGYYEEKGIEADDTLNKATKQLIKTAGREYASQLSFPFMKQYGTYAMRYYGVCKIVIYVCVAVVLILLIILMFLHRRKYRGVRYVNYGLLSGSILAIIINVHLHKMMNNNIKTDDSVYYNIIHRCINQAYTQGFYICLGGILAFILMCCVTLYFRKEVI